MTARLAKTRLLFIDSDNGGSTINPQGEFKVQLPTHALDLKPNEYLRFSLVDFHMYKNFYNINATNNCIMVSVDGGSTYEEIRIPPKNYENYNEIVSAFRTALEDSSTFSLFTGSETTSGLGTTPNTTGDRILRITLNKVAHGLSGQVIFQTRDYTDPSIRGGDFTRDHNDSYAILGSKRVQAVNTNNSFTIDDSSDPDNITITGFYPMQRSTMEHVYLRSDLVNDNFATRSYDSSLNNHDISMVHSDIFGKMGIQHEFVSYTELGGVGAGYFADVFRKGMSSITFRLTDHKHRNIQEVAEDQDILGNNNFTMTLRVETYEFPDPTKIERIPHAPQKTNQPNLLDRRRIPF